LRIFVDIGAHYGESVFKALNPSLGFDLILAFEPSSYAVNRIKRIKDSRLLVRHCALGPSNKRMTLYGSGSLGASIYDDKKGNTLVPSETIFVKNASEELRKYVIPENEIFLKLNCEGSEIEILQNLKASGLLKNIDHIYVDWDARKIPSLQEQYLVFRKKLLDENYDITSADQFPIQGWVGVEKWLGEFKNSKVNFIKKVKYKTFSFLFLKFRFKELLKYYFPSTIRRIIEVKVLGLKIGAKK
jgi:FkbM family methyltransferase